MKTACVIRQIIYMNDLFYTHLALCMTALINPTAIPSFRLTNLSFRIFLVCGFILCRNLKISIIFNQYSRLLILTFHRYTNSLRYSIILFFRSTFSILRCLSICSSPPQRPMTSDIEGISISDFINYFLSYIRCLLCCRS